MTRSPNDRIKAFHLYCEGVPQDRIALAVGAGARTIATWIKKYEWQKSKDELAPLIKENSKSDSEKLNADLMRSVKRVWAKSVENGSAKASARDMLETVKMERLVRGESTENIKVAGDVKLVTVFPKDFVMPKKKEIK